MVDFDAQQAQVDARAHQNQVDYAQARITYLEQSVVNMANALHQIQNAPPPVPLLGPLPLGTSASLVSAPIPH